MFQFSIPFLMGGTILQTIWERKHHFIGNFGEEAPVYWLFYWLNLGGSWWSLLHYFMSKTMLEVGWRFILWSMFYLEDWSSR